VARRDLAVGNPDPVVLIERDPCRRMLSDGQPSAAPALTSCTLIARRARRGHHARARRGTQLHDRPAARQPSRARISSGRRAPEGQFILHSWRFPSWCPGNPQPAIEHTTYSISQGALAGAPAKKKN
jgi:hypothetical protein